MATITPAKIKTCGELQQAIATLTSYYGRILLGNSISNRRQIDQLRAIWITAKYAADQQYPNKLYLLPAPKATRQSRASQWKEACNAAEEALGTMQELQSDAASWLDRLEHRGNETTRSKLCQITYVAIDRIRTEIQEAMQLDFPTGFGRD